MTDTETEARKSRWRNLVRLAIPHHQSKLRFVFNCLAMLLSVFGVYSGWSAFMGWLAVEPAKSFQSYVWFTLLMSVAMTAFVVIIWERLNEELGFKKSSEDLGKEAAALRARAELHDRAHVIQHRLVELVRAAALAEGSFDPRNGLDKVGNELRLYLARRLGVQRVAITVKQIRKQPTSSAAGDKDELEAIWRDAEQSQKRTASRQHELLDKNYIFAQFDHQVHEPHDSDGRRCIVVHDLEASDVWEPLKLRGRDRGYRTILVLPLNHPSVLKPPSTPAQDPRIPSLPVGGNLVGFLGIDTDKSNVFEDFFEAKDPQKGLGNTGDNHRPKDEMHFLFGVTDALALLIRLVDNPLVSDKPAAAAEPPEGASRS